MRAQGWACVFECEAVAFIFHLQIRSHVHARLPIVLCVHVYAHCGHVYATSGACVCVHAYMFMRQDYPAGPPF